MMGHAKTQLQSLIVPILVSNVIAAVPCVTTGGANVVVAVIGILN
jgi:hypothetical protein